MLRIASNLVKPFPEVRVDFYIFNDKPVFGELTFSAGYGDLKEEYLNYLGDKIDLTKLPRVDFKQKFRSIKKNNK